MPIAHAGTGRRESERSESEKRRPDGEVRNEPCQKGSPSEPALRSVDLDGPGPACDQQPGDQKRMTLVTWARRKATWARAGGDVGPAQGDGGPGRG